MDRPETNSVDTTPEQASPEQASPEQATHDAKARFLAASAKVDVLQPLRKHPWATVMSAAVVGAVAGSLEGVLAQRNKHLQQASPAQPSTPSENLNAKHGAARYAELFAVLQPVLASGAKMLLGWWVARQQAQATETNPDLQNTGQFE